MTSDNQLTLLSVPAPAIPSSIDLRCCSVQDLIADYDGSPPSLVVADPPWAYNQAPGHSANPDNHYQTMTDDQIVAVLDSAYDLVDRGRLALWMCWPFLDQWHKAIAASRWRWRFVSGGAWLKNDSRSGTGFHWIGQTEPVILYVKGTGLCTQWGNLTNGHAAPRNKHSEKPWRWMAQWLERWTQPGDTVIDLFAGMAPLAVAAFATGRNYVGAELDPARHRQAIDRIALSVSNLDNV